MVALRIAFVVIGLGLWFFTQWLIGARPPMGENAVIAGQLLSRHDAIFVWTERINHTLRNNDRAADALLITSSAVIDLLGLGLLAVAIFGRSLRPFLGLLMLFALRQFCQAVCELPPPEGIIWRSPGVPTLLVTYGVANDFFFSGHTGIAVLGAVELSRLNGRWWWIPGTAIVAFEATAVLVLRAHYTLDVFTGLVTALLVAALAARLAPPVDAALERLTAVFCRCDDVTNQISQR
jgi:hypothetical protein